MNAVVCIMYNIQYGGLNVVAVAVVIDRRLCFIALQLRVRHVDCVSKQSKVICYV